MRSLFLVAASAALASAAASEPAPADPPQAVRCTVSGIVASEGPVVVRTAPGPASPAAGTLPPPDPQAELDRPASFNIAEARGGWFRVENAAPWSMSPLERPGLSGWISGRDVGFSLQTHMGFAEPDPASAVRYRSRHMNEPDTLAALDCRGEWVKLLFSEGGELRQGWFRGVCDNPDTSCDMPPGDAYRD
ncbi:hypothetical protein [Allosphingosinicella sp.]|jgi:hypothetical protein|uniref:hypothetical protein n=1 Tax=Allosphingosinicella sp. TaxID=2823234 RepID=UPI002F12B67D